MLVSPRVRPTAGSGDAVTLLSSARECAPYCITAIVLMSLICIQQEEAEVVVVRYSFVAGLRVPTCLHLHHVSLSFVMQLYLITLLLITLV